MSKRPLHVPIFMSSLCAWPIYQVVNDRVFGLHTLACSSCHRHSCLAPQDSFVALPRFDWLPNTQLSVFHHQAARAQIFLVSLLPRGKDAMHYCSCSATDPISSISVPQPSHFVLGFKIAQTWSFCEVVCRILLAGQHSSSLASLTKQCFILKNRYAYARVSIIHPWYRVFAFPKLTKRCHGKSQKGQ